MSKLEVLENLKMKYTSSKVSQIRTKDELIVEMEILEYLSSSCEYARNELQKIKKLNEKKYEPKELVSFSDVEETQFVKIMLNCIDTEIIIEKE